jgi:photosystem II stability/assembly factor-like uncharacterized protein
MNDRAFQSARVGFVVVLSLFGTPPVAAQQLQDDAAADHAVITQKVATTPEEVGGRVLILYSHPQLPKKLWAGTSHGGLWRSDDEGLSWRLASELIKNRAVKALAIDPLNPEVMFAGTGNGHSSEVAARGNGMFKSGDGGASWSLLPLTSPAAVGENWSHINSIAISTSGVVLAATSDNKANGYVYRSTDGGQSWGVLPVYIGSKVGPHNMIHQVRFDPANPDKAIFMDDYANLTYSGDGGASWGVVRKSSGTCK